MPPVPHEPKADQSQDPESVARERKLREDIAALEREKSDLLRESNRDKDRQMEGMRREDISRQSGMRLSFAVLPVM